MKTSHLVGGALVAALGAGAAWHWHAGAGAAEPAAGKAEVSATIALGYGETRAERFLMVKEGGAWKVDDLFSESFPKGLKAALREEIANPQAE